MNRKMISLLLAAALLAGMLSGCGVISEIAGNVADAAMAELEKQIKDTFETYKVDVVEMKTAVGKLNGSDGKIQFFCAALVKSESASVPQSCADALSKVFTDAGLTPATGSRIESPYLQHKEISFKFTDFDSSADYYVIYAYMDDLAKFLSLQPTEAVG